jgi:hypothetical protein
MLVVSNYLELIPAGTRPDRRFSGLCTPPPESCEAYCRRSGEVAKLG